MKNIIIIITCIMIALVFSTNNVDAKTKHYNKAKKTKVVKMNKISKSRKSKNVTCNCPCCNGSNNTCVYWVHNENRHMTEIEIADFEYWEGHYIDENGNVHEK